MSLCTFHASQEIEYTSGAVLDSGACCSVVGKETLDAALKILNLERVPNAEPERLYHRFGTHVGQLKTICAVKLPFWNTEINEPIFDVHFDEIKEDLPFLFRPPHTVRNECEHQLQPEMVGSTQRQPVH